MGSFQKKKKLTVKQFSKRLLHVIELIFVVLALVLPMFLLSNQLEKVHITSETSSTYSLQDWLQVIIGFIELL
jgi:hypothetical protein